MKRSLAAVQTGVRNIELVSFPVPEELAPGFGLLRVEASGMCGTDVSQYVGATQSLGMYDYPAVLGHEAVGYIEALSPEAERKWGVKCGDRIAVEPATACERCGKCRSGRPKLCTKRFVYGFRSTTEAPSLWGAYSEYMLLHPDSRLHVIPDDLPLEEAVLFNALAGGFQWTVKSAGTHPGDNVVIIGPGLRGLAGIIAARQTGARNIIVIGRGNARKAELASLLGATHILDSTESGFVDKVREITGEGAQRIIDFTPHADWALDAAIGMAEPGGTIVIVGVKGQTVPLASDQVMHKALTIKGVNGPESWGYSQAVDLLISRREPAHLLHSHSFPFTDAELAIRTLAGEIGDPPLGIAVRV